VTVIPLDRLHRLLGRALDLGDAGSPISLVASAVWLARTFHLGRHDPRRPLAGFTRASGFDGRIERQQDWSVTAILEISSADVLDLLRPPSAKRGARIVSVRPRISPRRDSVILADCATLTADFADRGGQFFRPRWRPFARGVAGLGLPPVLTTVAC